MEWLSFTEGHLAAPTCSLLQNTIFASCPGQSGHCESCFWHPCPHNLQVQSPEAACHRHPGPLIHTSRAQRAYFSSSRPRHRAAHPTVSKLGVEANQGSEARCKLCLVGLPHTEPPPALAGGFYAALRPAFCLRPLRSLVVYITNSAWICIASTVAVGKILITTRKPGIPHLHVSASCTLSTKPCIKQPQTHKPQPLKLSLPLSECRSKSESASRFSSCTIQPWPGPGIAS